MEKKQEAMKRDYIVEFEPIEIFGPGYNHNERRIINNIQVNVNAEDIEKAMCLAWQMVNINDSEYEVSSIRTVSPRYVVPANTF